LPVSFDPPKSTATGTETPNYATPPLRQPKRPLQPYGNRCREEAGLIQSHLFDLAEPVIPTGASVLEKLLVDAKHPIDENL